MHSELINVMDDVRINRRLSMAAFSTKLGNEKNYWSQIMRGTRLPSAAVVRRFVAEFACEDWLEEMLMLRQGTQPTTPYVIDTTPLDDADSFIAMICDAEAFESQNHRHAQNRRHISDY